LKFLKFQITNNTSLDSNQLPDHRKKIPARKDHSNIPVSYICIFVKINNRKITSSSVNIIMAQNIITPICVQHFAQTGTRLDSKLFNSAEFRCANIRIQK